MIFRSAIISLCLTATFVVGAPAAERGSIPPSVRNTQNPKDSPLAPAEALKRMRVPAGFKVSLFAAEPDVAQPIAMSFDDRGRLWVLENYSYPKWQAKGTDRILIFEDVDGDGRYDKRKVFWDKGNYSTGLLVGHGGVWVCNTPQLLFIPDADGDDVPDGEPVVVLDGWSKQSKANAVNNLNWGPDGWLYGCIGCAGSSHVGRPGTPKEKRTQISRGIWRYHPTRRTFEVVARGVVNPWGLDWNEMGEPFFTNCVIAHLWHLIPGAYYERRQGESDYRYVYERIGPTCDHLHWGGGAWTNSRGGQGKHSVAGGGHAHTGAMIYLGDNWPAKYRDTLLTNNIHGDRLNNDLLLRRGSGYVGRHSKDFLFANDVWFRSLTQKYGPDGGVFMSDWQDYGECHDSDGVHRTSGRIYKIWYQETKPVGKLDLAKMDDGELVALQLHKNDWYVRHARRILQERAAAGRDLSEAKSALRRMFDERKEVDRKLRALWALWGIGGLSSAELIKHLGDDNEHVRSWAVRLLVDEKKAPAAAIRRFAEMARDDPSPLVRLYLAAAMQRIPLDQRWDIATALVAHEEDADDRNLPQMIWYGIEPAVGADKQRAVKLISQCKIAKLRKHIARRVSEK